MINCPFSSCIKCQNIASDTCQKRTRKVDEPRLVVLLTSSYLTYCSSHWHWQVNINLSEEGSSSCQNVVRLVNKGRNLMNFHSWMVNVHVVARLGTTKIFVGNIRDGTTSESLRELFECYGRVTEADVLSGFGFVVSVQLLYFTISLCNRRLDHLRVQWKLTY